MPTSSIRWKRQALPYIALHDSWADLDAPDIAKVYWKLSTDAKWVHALKCMFADECNHRDVNHTFAVMESDDPNPFVQKLQKNAATAWRLNAQSAATDLGCRHTLEKQK